MTKAQIKARDEARDELRKFLKPGDTVWTHVEHVARSGMSREITVKIPIITGTNGSQTVDFLHPNWLVAKALGLRQGKRDGLIMGGCGMDMGFALVYELSHALFGTGYACLGQGCPSNYHRNVHLEGVPERFDLTHTDGYALRQRWL